MASILDRYGIKEVADVTFYKLNEDGTQGEGLGHFGVLALLCLFHVYLIKLFFNFLLLICLMSS